METDILIPGQHYQWAIEFIDYAQRVFECGFPLARKIAKQIVNARYWEAYDCKDDTRQEYWRVVEGVIDVMKENEYVKP